MGGSIFNSQGVEARRIYNREFTALSNEILGNVLIDLFENSCVVRSYLDKQSHGDIDFLVSAPRDTYTNWKYQINNHPIIKQEATHFATNNDECSILFRGIQLDFRIIKPKYWSSSTYFCDDDPMGNSLGRIARFFGARFGYKGLYYPVYTENGCEKLGEIDLTSEPAEISNFFGLSSINKTWGFNTKEDIFDYIISGKYFAKECFNAANWDHATRTRNRKRKLFCEFIEYIERNQPKDKHVFLPKEQKNEYLLLFNTIFPMVNLANKVIEMRGDYIKNKELNKKFNGSLVISWVGVTGSDLGKLLGAYKGSKENWAEFLENNSPESIKKDFIDFYKFLR